MFTTVREMLVVLHSSGATLFVRNETASAGNFVVEFYSVLCKMIKVRFERVYLRYLKASVEIPAVSIKGWNIRN